MDTHLLLLQIVITSNIQNMPINPQIISSDFWIWNEWNEILRYPQILEDSKELHTRYASECTFKYSSKNMSTFLSNAC